MAGFSCGGGRGGRPAGMGRAAMGFMALLVLGDWNMLEGAVLSEKAFSVGAAVEAEEDKWSDKAS